MSCTLRRSAALAGVVVALALAFTVLRPAPTPGPFGRDFEAYYAAGATWNAGGDPWSREVWRVERTIPGVESSRDELLPYVGPAAALPLFGAFARLPFRTAVLVWTGLLAIASASLVVAALVLARKRDVTAVIAAFGFALASGPMLSAIALGQTAALAAAGIACALVAYHRAAVHPRSIAAYAGGAFATLLGGLQPNLTLALIARTRDRAALVCAALGAAAFAGLTLAAGGGMNGFIAYLHRLGEHGRAEQFTTIQHTPGAIAYAFGATEAAAFAAGAALALATLVAVVVVTVRARLDALDGTLLALAALPLIVPFFHEHDFMIELIPLLIVALRGRGAARAWGGVAAVLVLVDWFGLAQREPAHAQIVAQGIALWCAFVALGSGARARRADLAPLIAFAAIAGTAVVVARASPAPTWPDALPPGYRAAARADASAVWAEEQWAAGLDARQPAWGALRAIPLGGCVVLGCTVVLARRRRAAVGYMPAKAAAVAAAETA